MVNRKIILDAYKQGPEAVISFFEETLSKLEKRVQELENDSKKRFWCKPRMLSKYIQKYQLNSEC